MNRRMNAARIRGMRGVLLGALRAGYPGYFAASVLRAGLAGTAYDASLAEIVHALHYLGEKGYVSVRVLDDGLETMHTAVITARGIDLLDGAIEPDVGVEVS